MKRASQLICASLASMLLLVLPAFAVAHEPTGAAVSDMAANASCAPNVRVELGDDVEFLALHPRLRLPQDRGGGARNLTGSKPEGTAEMRSRGRMDIPRDGTADST